jgi:hypothetical protein
MNNVSQLLISSQLGLVPSSPIEPVTHGRSSGTTALPSSALGDAGAKLLGNGDNLISGAQRAGTD